MIYHYTFIRIGKIKKIKVIPYAGNDVKKLSHSYTAVGNVKNYIHCGNVWHATTI